MPIFEITREEFVRRTYIIADAETEDEAFEACAAGDYTGQVVETISVNDETTSIQKTAP